MAFSTAIPPKNTGHLRAPTSAEAETMVTNKPPSGPEDAEDFQLSPSQQEAAEAFQEFLLDPNKHEMCISGFAGSGKTYLTMKLVELVEWTVKLDKMLDGPESKKSVTRAVTIYMTATTNKAVGVLKEQFAQHYLNLSKPIQAMTIHSLLGLRVDNNHHTGETKLVATGDRLPLVDSVIFIDEASMVDDELLGIIRDVCRDTNKSLPSKGRFCKLVFIGDSYQLPPVGKSTTPVFTPARNLSQLREIQRQSANNPIIQLSAQYRNVLDHPDAPWPDLKRWEDNKAIFLYDSHPEFLKEISKAYLSPAGNAELLTDMKILAWTNNSVQRYNAYVRHLLNYQEDFQVGDLLVSNKPLIASGKNMVLDTDAIYTLRGKVDHSIPLKLPKTVIAALTPEQQTMYNQATGVFEVYGYLLQLSNGARVFQPSNWGIVNMIMKQLASVRAWPMYFQLKEQWADLRPGYALTCHKSQGSTYDQVFIDLDDIGRNTKWYEVIRLIYVSITRARYSVHLFGDVGQRYHVSIAKELQRQKAREEFSNVQDLL